MYRGKNDDARLAAEAPEPGQKKQRKNVAVLQLIRKHNLAVSNRQKEKLKPDMPKPKGGKVVGTCCAESRNPCLLPSNSTNVGRTDLEYENEWKLLYLIKYRVSYTHSVALGGFVHVSFLYLTRCIAKLCPY